jgi:hypothetical protein
MADRRTENLNLIVDVSGHHHHHRHFSGGAA